MVMVVIELSKDLHHAMPRQRTSIESNMCATREKKCLLYGWWEVYHKSLCLFLVLLNFLTVFYVSWPLAKERRVGVNKGAPSAL